ncbi:hypothetical protein M407DRAFT_245187 [Tulasnella calospora MUT 4182]|uniref:Uncharacterized protein n=1 Tax=Tulasnella calospora MUT 4182 TaxID=1051891 RepID=A0A0C3LM72_9AGAM|nr:hypothetical protein M407DRAFT_245187 [Tulasnella calospora MUT 4182]
MSALDDICAGLCGFCVICCSSALESWCMFKRYGSDGCGCCGCRCGGSRGCCPSCGGFDDEDAWDKEDRERAAATSAANTPTIEGVGPNVKQASSAATPTQEQPKETAQMEVPQKQEA